MALSRSGDSTRQWRGITWPKGDELLISEIFGPTIQGEGPNAGKPAIFVRLGACHLSCAWCDTGYTWDASRYNLSAELQTVPIREVANAVLRHATKRIIITGGEPALQADRLTDFADIVRNNGYYVEVETSGTISLGPLSSRATLIVVSPKTHNSGLRLHQRLRAQPLVELVDNPAAVFKFVVEKLADLDEIAAMTEEFDIDPNRVWIMPEGCQKEVIADRLVNMVPHIVDRGWAVSSRLHILLWGDRRGH